MIHSPTAHVYLFWHKQVPYVAIVDEVSDHAWLVMFALNGLLESAYIVERPERYLSKPEFTYIDELSKVMPHDDE